MNAQYYVSLLTYGYKYLSVLLLHISVTGQLSDTGVV